MLVLRRWVHMSSPMTRSIHAWYMLPTFASFFCTCRSWIPMGNRFILGMTVDFPIFLARNCIRFCCSFETKHPQNNFIVVALWQINMEPEHHPFEKDTYFPNFHFWVPWKFPGSIHLVHHLYIIHLPYQKRLTSKWINTDCFCLWFPSVGLNHSKAVSTHRTGLEHTPRATSTNRL